MTDIALRSSGLEATKPSQSIEQIKHAIEQITTVEQAVEAGNITRGLTAYAKAKQSLELANQAIELRIWAERKGGEAIVKNGDKIGTLKKNHGINSATAHRWIALYLIDREFIQRYIDDTTAADRQLSLTGLVALGRAAGRKRVAPGVFKEINGSFSIQWKEYGRTHSQTGLKSREQAVRTLEQRRRFAKKVREHSGISGRKHVLDKSYSLLRLTLDQLGSVKAPSLLVKEVLDHLYKAEDALARAQKEEVVSAGQVADKRADSPQDRLRT